MVLKMVDFKQVQVIFFFEICDPEFMTTVRGDHFDKISDWFHSKSFAVNKSNLAQIVSDIFLQ